MNSLLEFTDCPGSVLPNHAFSTSKEWYSAMADMHLAQLTFQHNDAVEDEDDARDKYVVRQLFRKLAYDGRLATGFGPQNDDVCESTFRLFSEDLRPSNVLINEDLKVVGVIDWEFAYAAPTHFSFDPPWWLLLESPERWPDGFEDWIEAYKPRLETFLSVLEDEEKSLRAERGVSNGLESLSISSDEGLCLSQQMRRNWEDESWMIRYAARNSWVLDFIFYRLPLLTQQQSNAMEPFIKFKMEQSKERILVQWNDEDAKAELSKVML